jgi:hypothetical protein
MPGLHHGLVNHQRSRGKIFKIKVCVIAASGKSRRKIALKIVFREAVMLEEESIFVHVN